MQDFLRTLLLAVQFFTRIPLPSPVTNWVGFTPSRMQAAMSHMPAMGWLVGACAAVAFWGTRALWGTPAMLRTIPMFIYALAAIISTAATLWVTGCFHEDGLADVADGLGGFAPAERSLQIMKDPRIGNYALWATLVAFSLKISMLAVMARLSWHALLCTLFAAHVLSRFFPLVLANYLPHVGLGDQSKTQQATGVIERINLLPAVLWCLPLFGVYFLRNGGLMLQMVMTAAAVAACVTLYMGRWFHKRLQGFTGDCLGATQQVCELACYAAALTVLIHR